MGSTYREQNLLYKDKRRQKAEKQISKPRAAKKTKGRKRYKIQCRRVVPVLFRKYWGVDWWTCGRYHTKEQMATAFREYTKRGSVYGSLRTEFRCVFPDGTMKTQL